MPSYRLQELFHDLREGIPLVNVDESRTTPRTVRVDVPTDYDTVADALADLEAVRPAPGLTFEVNIESGHEWQEQATVERADLGHVRLVSEDPTVSLAAGYPDDRVLQVTEQAVGPQWDFLLDGGGQTVPIGIRVRRQSGIAFGNTGDYGIQNLDGEGVSIVGGSLVRCDGLISRDHTDRGISVSNGSRGRGTGMTLTNNGGRPLRVGAAIMDAQNGDMSGGGAPVYISSGAVVNLSNSTVNNAASFAIEAHQANVNAAGVGIDQAASPAVEAEGSYVDLTLASITATDSHGIRLKTSICPVQSASITGSVGDDVHCRDGSIVQARGTTTSSSTSGEIAAADCNITPNSLNGQGAILSETVE